MAGPQGFDINAYQQQAYDTAYGFLTKNGVAPWLAQPLAGLVGLGFVFIGTLRFAVYFAIADLAVPVATTFLEIIAQVRQDGAAEFAKLSAAVLGEFMGIETGDIDLSTNRGAAANLQRARAIGGKIHDMLRSEFTDNGRVATDTGENAARAFSGFATNFAVTNAMLSLIAEMVSLDEVQQLRELGVEVAEVLGLGRLHRQAMMPLIRNTVAEPYDRKLRSEFRQDRLSEAQYAVALARGTINEQDVRTALAEKGYPDNLISELLAQHAGKISLADVALLRRYGALTPAESQKYLALLGYDANTGELAVQAQYFGAVDTQQQAYAGELLHLLQQRYIEQTFYQAELQKLNLPPGELEIRLARASVWLESQHHHLTFAEMLYLHENAIITSGDFDTWADEMGYNDRDKMRITLYVAEKEIELAAKKKPKPPATAGTPPAHSTGG